MFKNRLKTWTVALAAMALVLLPGVAGAQKAGGASTPEAAVRQLLDPAVNPSAGGNCSVITGKLDGCYVSERFARRVASATENGNIVIRSQNPAQKINYTLLDNDGKTAHVDAQFIFGAMMYTITFVVINPSTAWVVDDSYCKDAPETSIYNAPTGPCNVIAAGGTGGGVNPSTQPTVGAGTPTPEMSISNTPTAAGPGMPNTGSGTPVDGTMLVWGVFGVVVVVAGLTLLAAGLRSRKV